MLLKEAKYVPALVTDEAVIHAAPGRNGEVAALSLVKRAGPAVVGPRALEIHVLADDLHDVRALTYLLDRLVGYHRLPELGNRHAGSALGVDAESEVPYA